MRVWRLLPAAVLAATLLAAAPAAQAARVDDGEGRVRFDRATLGALTDARVVVGTLAPATAGRRRAAFPVTGGDLNPATGFGFVSHRGALAFTVRGTRRYIEFQQLRVKLGRDATLTGRVAETRIIIARLRGPLVARHDAEGVSVRGPRIELTRLAATALNRALDVDVFRPGTRLGTLAIDASLSQLVLTGGYTALTPDASTVEALAAQGITLTAARGTRLGTAGDVIFPVVSGLVERDTLVGRIRHGGALVLTQGEREVPIGNFNADISRRSVLTMLTEAGRLPIADIALPDAPPAVSRSLLTVEGIGLALSAEAASALNLEFSTTAFRGGMPLGTAVIRAEIL